MRCCLKDFSQSAALCGKLRGVMNKTVFFVVALFASPHSFSDSASGDFTAYGLGSISCDKYSSLSKNGSGRGMANQWAHGFVTAKNESLHFNKMNSYLEGIRISTSSTPACFIHPSSGQMMRQ
jgi:hypothetical protein